MKLQNAKPEITFTGAVPEPDEAAAAIAAIEQFVAETTPAPQVPEPGMSAWQRAALVEGVSAKRSAFPADPGTGFPVGL